VEPPRWKTASTESRSDGKKDSLIIVIWGSLQRCPEPLARFKEPTSKGREGRKDGGKSKGEDGTYF